MAELSERFAPYAPATSVVLVLRRLRDRGLADPLTIDELERVGVPASMGPRTHQTLRFLNLVDEDGHKAEAYERLRNASSTDYPGELERVLRSAYAKVFEIVDPSQDSETALMDAFRHFEPAPQRVKMVRLFRGLAREAGLIVATGRTVTVPLYPPRGTPSRGGHGHGRVRSTVRTVPDQGQAQQTATARTTGPAAAGYSVIKAIIDQLPADGRWTSKRRTRWLHAITSAVDLVVETVDEGEEGKTE